MMVRKLTKIVLVTTLLTIQGLNVQTTQAKPVASFSWSMGQRYAKSWAAVDGSIYDAEYINPKSWQVILDACQSAAPGNRIAAYGWAIEAKDFDYSFPKKASSGTVASIEGGTKNAYYASEGCKWRIELPRLGAYKIELVVVAANKETSITTGTINLQDLLYVSLGDSLSSGEGNPDRPGEYKLDKTLWLFNDPLGDTEVKRLAEWQNRKCHRSALSGPALAAQRIESLDPHASVTFLSFACSGAETRHLYREAYEGQEPNYYNPQIKTHVRDHRKLPPQIEALRQTVGNRRIDVLLISIGINDLYFSDVINACATNKHLSLEVFDDPDCVDKAANQLQKLPARYDELAQALRGQLNVAKVYIAEYPSNIFKGSGCGWLEGIRNDEIARLRRTGDQLNTIIRDAARRHGWNVLRSKAGQRIVHLFEGHHYCADDSYFVGLTDSIKKQGPKHGALHPNEKGHRAFRDLIVESITTP
jgi:lysophospholipase L1-like esterase